MSSNAAGSGGKTLDKPARTIVIVDDDPVLVEALDQLLQEEGCFVEAFTDAVAALDRLRTGPRPDMVLLDYVMPAMSGEEFLEQMTLAGLNLHIVVFTAKAEALFSKPYPGIAAILKKPHDLERLLDHIQHVLGNAPA